jgi:hypothetical protein
MFVADIVRKFCLRIRIYRLNEKQQLPNSNNNLFQIIKQFNYAKNWTPLVACR